MILQNFCKLRFQREIERFKIRKIENEKESDFSSRSPTSLALQAKRSSDRMKKLTISLYS